MTLRVAVVGAGAAGMYAVHHLLEQTAIEVEIDIFERLPTPWGLVRAGVAPDHPEKKAVIDRLFQFYLRRPNVRLFCNVAIGTDVSAAELAAHYPAVVYAVGADDDRALGIAGEDLAGSWSAREFVAWYNGHPAYSERTFDLSHRRAVIVGTGNVALDVARILTLPVPLLARTDIADHALAALRASKVREVVVLGRRGCHQAAFHNPELEELAHLEDIAVGFEADDLARDPADGDWHVARKLATMRRLQARQVEALRKQITFRFHRRPIAVLGEDRVRGIAVEGPNGAAEQIDCGLVLRAIGYRGRPLPGLPFDAASGTIANDAGRVVGDGHRGPGTYVTGWIRRGPRGVIGSNKLCAAETIHNLIADARAGLLHPCAGSIDALLARRGLQVVSSEDWQRIDAAERNAGRPRGRPRIKQTRIAQLLATAHGGRA